ncbi:MAG: LysE family transporter [Alphaproteobacteria bacterium]|nr:LysE family transporter [Alphaproteobacteria bacterium]
MLSLAGLNMVALISPGPDFAVVLRNSLIYSRKTALLTAGGIALGSLVHVSYTLFGLGLIIKENAWLFLIVKYAGASYLLYIGYNGLRAKATTSSFESVPLTRDISSVSAVWSGFLTNALNPKCMLFFVSLFSVVISPNTPTLIIAIYGAIIFVETLLWFSFVAFCLSGKRMREKFKAVGHWIARVTGGGLVMLGVKLLFTA